MFLNAPIACPKEVFRALHLTDRSFSPTKGTGYWLDKDLVQRCEELVQRRLSSKESCSQRSGTLVCTNQLIRNHCYLSFSFKIEKTAFKNDIFITEDRPTYLAQTKVK